MEKDGEWRLVSFDGRIQSYFPDGSIIEKTKENLTFYSTKGNKMKIGIDAVKHSQEVAQKLHKIVNKMSIFEDQYYTVLPVNEQNQLIQTSEKSFFKKYKISQFHWQTSQVRETELGFETKSDDANAKVTLDKDLYRIHVVYPQKTGGRKVTEDTLYLTKKNRKKELIEKYGGKYVEYPQNMLNIEIQYQYIQMNKQFTMFNLPSRWCPPMRKIWCYLLANDIISHPFCYIDFQDPDNKALRQIETTKMPQVVSLISQHQDLSLEQIAIPLYGKPNHSYKWKWLSVERENLNLTAYYVEGGDCVVHDNFGFWFIEDTNAFYKTINKDGFDYKVSLNAFPITVRIQGQQPREVKNHILAAANYKNHRDFIEKRPKEQENIVNNQSEQIICEEDIDQVGKFKAYGNGVVVGRFDDRTMITIRNEEIRIIAPNGKSLQTSLRGTPPKQFQQHLKWLTDWHQQIFHPQEYQKRQILSRQLQKHINSTQTFIQIAKHFQNSA